MAYWSSNGLVMNLGSGGSGISLGGNNNGPAAGTPGTTTQQSQSSTTQGFANPDLAAMLANLLGGVSGNASTSFMDYLKNPVDSPLFQSQLGALLNSLRGSEANSRTALTDQFRAAGGLRSGAYGNAASSLENDILGNREKTAANLLGQSFGPMTQALLGAMGQINPLLNALKMTNSSATSSGTSVAAPSNSGGNLQMGGGMSSGGGSMSGSFGSPGVNPGASPYYGSFGTPGAFYPSGGGGMQMTPDIGGMSWGTDPSYWNEGSGNIISPDQQYDFGGGMGGYDLNDYSSNYDSGFDWGGSVY